ncbi:hypothetical protein PQX77_009593 [Marasmius sp. AFHP31]|nr:hypothetical protein PQX77_009593 [Marasmius sp. AFHP31]
MDDDVSLEPGSSSRRCLVANASASLIPSSSAEVLCRRCQSSFKYASDGLVWSLRKGVNEPNHPEEGCRRFRDISIEVLRAAVNSGSMMGESGVIAAEAYKAFLLLVTNVDQAHFGDDLPLPSILNNAIFLER